MDCEDAANSNCQNEDLFLASFILYMRHLLFWVVSRCFQFASIAQFISQPCLGVLARCYLQFLPSPGAMPSLKETLVQFPIGRGFTRSLPNPETEIGLEAVGGKKIKLELEDCPCELCQVVMLCELSGSLTSGGTLRPLTSGEPQVSLAHAPGGAPGGGPGGGMDYATLTGSQDGSDGSRGCDGPGGGDRPSCGDDFDGHDSEPSPPVAIFIRNLVINHGTLTIY